ncbi:helix-turn-helix domain-containing protein [Streptomyces chartreusis]|uniref:helix-turn-helix domain-containing protein n=1 Tax=Streptomyces chartreusis TaxID=1969 RepID=UPI0036957C54
MSIQLMVVAAYLPKEVISQTQKLVLMKIADSADDQTRLARPGLERMMAWAGVGEKRVIGVVTELVGLGLVERTEVGRVGRRAEYKVFPHGVPPIPSTEELIAWRRGARRAPTNARLARNVPRRRPSAAARTQQDVVAREQTRASEGAQVKGGFPQGNPHERPGRVSPGKPSGFPPGDQEGFPGETPSLPSPSSFLPYPLTPGAGATRAAVDPLPGCPVHPQPAANCRACGTNPRALRERAQREAAEQERLSQQEWLREFFAEQERRVAETDPQALKLARQRVRELARLGRTRRPNSSDG